MIKDKQRKFIRHKEYWRKRKSHKNISVVWVTEQHIKMR